MDQRGEATRDAAEAVDQAIGMLGAALRLCPHPSEDSDSGILGRPQSDSGALLIDTDMPHGYGHPIQWQPAWEGHYQWVILKHGL